MKLTGFEHFGCLKLLKHSPQPRVVRKIAQHRGSILAFHPAAVGSILGALNKFSLDVDEMH